MKAIASVSPDQTAVTLTATEFAALLPSDLGDVVAVAVSGGPDSMALALLTHAWATAHHKKILALIVEHGLRENSATETATVATWLAAHKIDYLILPWQHDAVTRAIQQTAREARYALLAKACKRHGIYDLLLGHHADDQMETLLLRVAKGSGIDGLAGMRATSMQHGLRLVRPLLTISKARLIATCTHHQQAFVSDPSNEAQKFARGRLRQTMAALASEGLDQARLLDLADRAASASDALEFYTQQLAQAARQIDAFGCITLDLAPMLAAPTEIALRLLADSLKLVGDRGYGPKRAALLEAWQTLAPSADIDAGCMLYGRTLHGCEINRSKNNLTIWRELAAARDARPIEPGETVIWDQRFTVTLHEQNAPPDLQVRALGLQDHKVLDALAPTLRRAMPRGRVRAALPALWDGDRLYAATMPVDDQTAGIVSARFLPERY
jgi:tRNA(Ile)-lysidine synthase